MDQRQEYGVYAEIALPSNQTVLIFDVDCTGTGSIITHSTRTTTLPQRHMIVTTSRQYVRIYESASTPLSDFRILIMEYHQDPEMRRIIGELMFAPSIGGYVSVALSNAMRGIEGFRDSLADVVLMVGFRCEVEADMWVRCTRGPNMALRQSIAIGNDYMRPGRIDDTLPGQNFVAAVVDRPFRMSVADWVQRRMERVDRTRPLGRTGRMQSIINRHNASQRAARSSASSESTGMSVYEISEVSSSPGAIEVASGATSSFSDTTSHVTILSISSELEAISIDSSTDDGQDPPPVKPEPTESISVNFREDPRVHPIRSDSDEPQAGPSCAVPSVRRSVRPRRILEGVLPEPTAPRRLPRSLRRRNLRDIRQRRLSGYNSDYEARELPVVEPAYHDFEVAELDEDAHGWCHICRINMVDYRWPCGHLTCTECARRCHAANNCERLTCYTCRQVFELLFHDHPMHGNFGRYVNVSRFETRYPRI